MKNTFLLFFFLCIAFFSTAQDFELRILENLSRHRTPGTTRFMQAISNSTSYITVGIPATAFVIANLDHDRQL
ncbi:MAG TPA: hypothetical protein VKR53_00135, partial [Puia sp.]|nr:hypothetical protein [Puia sp.]